MKLHPLTAVREAGRRALTVGSTAFFLVAIGSGALDLDLRLGLALVPLGAILGAAYGVAYYVRYEYDLAGGVLSIRSGVVGRREREIPLRRVQNVDVRQSLLQRLLGLAVVSVEKEGVDATGGPSPVTEPAVRTLFSIGDVELGVYALTSFQPSSLLFLVFAVPFGWQTASSIVLRLAAPLGGPTSIAPAALATVAGLTLAVVGALVAALGTWAFSALLTLLGYHGFTLGRAGDDLVYERGLLRRYSGSIPLSKVQTLTLVEHVLARRLGYAGLRVETAGYSAGGGGGGQNSSRPASAVPLATRERALALARSIEPFDELEFERPSTVARRRYAVRYLLVVLVLTGVAYGVGRLLAAVGVAAGLEYWPAPLLALPLVPVAAHLKWTNRGHHLGPDHVAIREGFWRRRTRIVPYYRLQTVETRRTVFQRRLGLASVVADTASSSSLLGGDAVAHDVATATGRRLHRELRAHLVAARATFGRGGSGDARDRTDHRSA